VDYLDAQEDNPTGAERGFRALQELLGQAAEIVFHSSIH
jgi:hypothetical protein